MSAHYAVVNGSFIKADEAMLSIKDLAIQRGYGIFDFFRTSDNRPVFLEDHLDRFYNSAAALRLETGISRESLKDLIFELISKNNLGESGIKLTLTGGDSDDGYTLGEPNLIISQSPFKSNAGSFEAGLRLVTCNYQRQLPHVKTIDYLQAIYLQPYIKENDAGDVLYHSNGEIRECPRANFFLVTQEDQVITPADNVLAGITRKKILDLTALNVEENLITIEAQEHAKEAFITSTSRQVLPVLSIDGKTVGNGKPGALTKKISEAFQSLRQTGGMSS